MQAEMGIVVPFVSGDFLPEPGRLHIGFFGASELDFSHYQTFVVSVEFIDFPFAATRCGYDMTDLVNGAFLKGWVPEAVAKAFSAVHEADYQTVVQHVYRGEAPSRYLGSFAPWILQWYGGDPWMTKLIEDNLRDFVEGFLRQYDPARYPVGVVGGFGAACEPILRALAPDLTFSRFLARPMDGLIAYYSK